MPYFQILTDAMNRVVSASDFYRISNECKHFHEKVNVGDAWTSSNIREIQAYTLKENSAVIE